MALTPPTGWDAAELTSYFNAMAAQGQKAFNAYVGTNTPPYLQPYLTEYLGTYTPSSPVTLFDFSAATLPPGVTLARDSAGLAFGPSGALTSFASNVPRFRYNPTTLALEGILNEAAATNRIGNASAGGGTPGSPGVQPLTWGTTGNTNGLVRTLAAATLEDGIACIDYKYTGTASAESGLVLSFTAGAADIPAVPGDTVNVAAQLSLQAGSWAGVFRTRLGFSQINSGGGALGNVFGPLFTVPGGLLRSNRFDVSLTVENAATAAARPLVRFDVSAGAAVDFTVRIGLPQGLINQPAGSLIATTSAPVARAADVLKLALPTGFYDLTIMTAGATDYRSAFPSVANLLTVPNMASAIQQVYATKVS